MTKETAKQLINVIEQGLCEKQHGIAKHWELVKKFADGAEIQIETYDGWVDIKAPGFQEDFCYREKPEPPKRWRADVNKNYWHIAQLVFPHVKKDIDFRKELSDWRYKMGNYFETEKEAQLVANLINKIFALLRDGVPVSEIEVKQIKKDYHYHVKQ